jgi:hypothetical protein
VWNVEELRREGFTVVRDTRDIPPPTDAVGGPVVRSLTARRDEPNNGTLCIELQRPWQKAGAPLSRLSLVYDLFGKEVGMPRALRRQLMAS